MNSNLDYFKPWAISNEKELAKYVIPDLAGKTAALKLRLQRFDEETTPAGRLKIIRHIYQALSARKINYNREKYNYQEIIQIIRTPYEVLEAPGEGTCLDLSILFCTLCLYYDLLPLLIIIEGHAFAAVSLHFGRKREGGDAWDSFKRQELAAIREGKGLLRDKGVLEQLVITRQEYLPVECTGFAFTEKLPKELPESKKRKNGYLSFDHAVEAAKLHFSSFSTRDFEYALDIHYLHEQGPLRPQGTGEHRGLPGSTRRCSCSTGSAASCGRRR